MLSIVNYFCLFYNYSFIEHRLQIDQRPFTHIVKTAWHSSSLSSRIRGIGYS